MKCNITLHAHLHLSINRAIYIHIHHFINLHYVKPRYSQLVPLSNIWWIYHWITTYLTATPWYLPPEYSYLLWLFQESWCMSMKIKLINSSLFRKLGIFSQNSSSTSPSTSRLKRLFQHISMGCCWTGTEDSFVKWCPQFFSFFNDLPSIHKVLIAAKQLEFSGNLRSGVSLLILLSDWSVPKESHENVNVTCLEINLK